MRKKLTRQETMIIVRGMDGIFTDGLHGDFIPHSWYTELQFEKINKRGEGRANLPAIIVLADICYWWRPKKDNDDDLHSGRTKKRFSKDRLHRSYKQYALKGLTKKQAADAVGYLESKGLIEVELRDEVVNGIYYKNRKYITPIPEAIRAITYNPQDKEEEANDDDIVPGSGVSPGGDTLSPGGDTLSPGGETYTKNTQKLLTETTSLSKEEEHSNTIPCNNNSFINGKTDSSKSHENLQSYESSGESKDSLPPAPECAEFHKITLKHVKALCYSGGAGHSKLVKWLQNKRIDLPHFIAFCGWFKGTFGYLSSPKPHPGQVKEHWNEFSSLLKYQWSLDKYIKELYEDDEDDEDDDVTSIEVRVLRSIVGEIADARAAWSAKRQTHLFDIMRDDSIRPRNISSWSRLLDEKYGTIHNDLLELNRAGLIELHWKETVLASFSWREAVP
jgi:hypothetical protein